jgi:predicted ATP-grasp superfamily ATP-dependent carboligase
MIPIVLQGDELGLGVVRSLGMENVKSILLYNEESEIARFSKYVVRSYRCPDWTKFEEIFHFLIRRGKELNGGVFIPTSDLHIEFLSKYKIPLSKYYSVPVPDGNITKLYLDKKETYEMARLSGIDTPVCVYPQSKKEALEMVRMVQFPMMIKPRERDIFFLLFHQKLFVVNNLEELSSKLDLCLENNINAMVAEIIPGADTQLFEYNFYVDKSGNVKAGMGHVKVRQAPANFGIGRVIKTSKNTAVEKLARKFIKQIPGFFGPGQIEFKYDQRDGKYKLIEMNGRLGLQNELYAKSGANFAYMFYQEWANRNISTISNTHDNEYYWIHLYYDLINFILHRNKENANLRDYIRPYIKKHTFCIERLNDPRPMLMYWLLKIRNSAQFFRWIRKMN